MVSYDSSAITSSLSTSGSTLGIMLQEREQSEASVLFLSPSIIAY
jgi:hypothetical protein